MSAIICDERYPEETSDVILTKWSKLVKDDFEKANPDIRQVSYNLAHHATVINQQSHMLHELRVDMAMIRQSELAKEKLITSLERTVSLLRESFMMAEQARSNTPTRKKSRSSNDQSPTMAPLTTHDLAASFTPAVAATATATATATAPAAAPVAATATTTTASATVSTAPPLPPVNTVNNRLSFNNNALQVAKGKKGAGFTLDNLLMEFSITGRLRQGEWKSVIVTQQQFEEPASVKSTLDLCYFVSSSEERDNLRTGAVPKEELMQLCSTISHRAFMKMWTLEGKDADAMKLINDKKGSQKKMPTYMAIGRRIRQYKKAVTNHTGTACTSICERPDGM